MHTSLHLKLIIKNQNLSSKHVKCIIRTVTISSQSPLHVTSWLLLKTHESPGSDYKSCVPLYGQMSHNIHPSNTFDDFCYHELKQWVFEWSSQYRRQNQCFTSIYFWLELVTIGRDYFRNIKNICYLPPMLGRIVVWSIFAL